MGYCQKSKPHPMHGRVDGGWQSSVMTIVCSTGLTEEVEYDYDLIYIGIILRITLLFYRFGGGIRKFFLIRRFRIRIED